MLMTTLRTVEEVRDVAQMPKVPLPKADPQMLAIAEKIVDQKAADFDPTEFVDRYEDALCELIEEKKKGHVLATPAPAKAKSNVIDLMVALKKSLKAEGDGRRPPATTPRNATGGAGQKNGGQAADQRQRRLRLSQGDRSPPRATREKRPPLSGRSRPLRDLGILKNSRCSIGGSPWQHQRQQKPWRARFAARSALDTTFSLRASLMLRKPSTSSRVWHWRLSAGGSRDGPTNTSSPMKGVKLRIDREVRQ